MRLRRPLRQIGKHAQQWYRWRETNYGLLALRCKGRCEGCGESKPLDPHHLIGRDSEPFSSTVELLAGLCRQCHDRWHGVIGGIDFELRRRLMDAAEVRVRKRFGVVLSDGVKVVELLSAAWEFEPETRRFVRKAA